jgi:hypothetical protein
VLTSILATVILFLLVLDLLFKALRELQLVIADNPVEQVRRNKTRAIAAAEEAVHRRGTRGYRLTSLILVCETLVEIALIFALVRGWNPWG